jgi:hypothetical protein
MQQVRLFKGVENDLASLEAEINAWIKSQNVKVLSIQGNVAAQSASGQPEARGLTRSDFSPSDIFVIVLYEQG